MSNSPPILVDLTDEQRNSVSQVSSPVNANPDLVDTLELFKNFLDVKLGDLKSQLIQEQDSIKKKIKGDVALKFKSEGNRIQHTLNEEVLESLYKLSKLISSVQSQASRIIVDLTDQIKGRNKLIRIADSSPTGWGTVNEVASDSDDEKKIRQAENRAIRNTKDKSKNRAHPFQRVPSRQQTIMPAESYGNPAFSHIRSNRLGQQHFVF